MSTNVYDLWEEYFDELEKSTMFKFKIGEKVEVKGSVLERVGKVIERHINGSGEREYVVEFGQFREEYFYEDDLKSHVKIPSMCECGASKTYGKNCTGLHHALWCKMRKD